MLLKDTGSCQEFDVHTADQAATLIEPLSQLAIVGNDASSEVHGELITLSQLLAKLVSIKDCVMRSRRKSEKRQDF